MTSPLFGIVYSWFISNHNTKVSLKTTNLDYAEQRWHSVVVVPGQVMCQAPTVPVVSSQPCVGSPFHSIPQHSTLTSIPRTPERSLWTSPTATVLTAASPLSTIGAHCKQHQHASAIFADTSLVVTVAPAVAPAVTATAMAAAAA